MQKNVFHYMFGKFSFLSWMYTNSCPWSEILRCMGTSCLYNLGTHSKGTFRLDTKQREVKVGDLCQLSRVVTYVTWEGCQPSQVVANLRDWSLHRLILITCFFNVFNEQKALCTLLFKCYYSNHRFCFVIAC